jgi:hypothetical protein
LARAINLPYVSSLETIEDIYLEEISYLSQGFHFDLEPQSPI